MKDCEKFVNERLQNGAKWVDLDVVMNEQKVEPKKIKYDGVLYKINLKDDTKEELARTRSKKEYAELQERRIMLNRQDIDKEWYYITVIEEQIY
jgi:hypothetical protein